jgi:hypothetical protein
VRGFGLSSIEPIDGRTRVELNRASRHRYLLDAASLLSPRPPTFRCSPQEVVGLGHFLVETNRLLLGRYLIVRALVLAERLAQVEVRPGIIWIERNSLVEFFDCRVESTALAVREAKCKVVSGKRWIEAHSLFERLDRFFMAIRHPSGECPQPPVCLAERGEFEPLGDFVNGQ